MVFFAGVALVGRWGTSEGPPSPEGVVARVIDGDTVVMADGRHVRYIGIDTPEMDSASQAKRNLAEIAKRRNEELVIGHAVVLEFDVEKKDRYGRTLAYIWVGGQMVNEILVREGLARASVYGKNSRHASRLSQAQELARHDAAQKGEAP